MRLVVVVLLRVVLVLWGVVSTPQNLTTDEHLFGRGVWCAILPCTAKNRTLLESEKIIWNLAEKSYLWNLSLQKKAKKSKIPYYGMVV